LPRGECLATAECALEAAQFARWRMITLGPAARAFPGTTASGSFRCLLCGTDRSAIFRDGFSAFTAPVRSCSI